MQTFHTVKELTFFPSIEVDASGHIHCAGREFQLPAGTEVFTALPEQSRGRWLITVPNNGGFRFVGVEDVTPKPY